MQLEWILCCQTDMRNFHVIEQLRNMYKHTKQSLFMAKEAHLTIRPTCHECWRGRTMSQPKDC